MAELSPTDALNEAVRDENWGLVAAAAFALVAEAAVAAAREAPPPSSFEEGARSALNVALEMVRATYRKIERGANASTELGTLMHALKSPELAAGVAEAERLKEGT